MSCIHKMKKISMYRRHVHRYIHSNKNNFCFFELKLCLWRLSYGPGGVYHFVSAYHRNYIIAQLIHLLCCRVMFLLLCNCLKKVEA